MLLALACHYTLQSSQLEALSCSHSMVSVLIIAELNEHCLIRTFSFLQGLDCRWKYYRKRLPDMYDSS